MVEVLVAVLLLAVGLVGALAMQAHAMRTRHESLLLTEALQAAAALADRIRANAAQSSAYLGFEFDAAVVPAADGPQVPAASCTDAPCDAVLLAQRELDEFRQHLRAALPAARAAICRDVAAAPDGQFQWPCSSEAGAPIVIKIGWHSRHAGSAEPGAPGVVLPVALTAPPAPGPAPAPPDPGGAP
jgi:type IV pilus assembly protein PilV